jgi:hypothetical protein
MGIQVLRGRFLDGKDVSDTELNEPKLDRRLTAKYVSRHRGSIRLSSGRYYTSKEWETKRKGLVKLALP